MRITSPERTLSDLAAVVDENTLESALESALRLRLTTLDRIQAKADERSGRGFVGCNRLRKLLDRRRVHDVDTDSDLEVAWERLSRRGGWPPPQRQYQHLVSDGSTGYADFAWPQAKVAVEVDGWKFHFGRRRWVRDSRKSNSLQIEGWIVLRFTKEDIVYNSDYVIATIRDALTPRLPLA